MSEIPVSSLETPNIWHLTGDVEVRVYALQSFMTNDGKFVIAGTVDTLTYYDRADVTVNTLVATIAAITLASTEDSTTNQQARYSAYFYNTRTNKRVGTLIENFTVPPTPTETSWPALTIHKQAVLARPDRTTLTTQQIEDLIASLSGPTTKQTDVLYGIGKLSVPAANSAAPIVVGDNDRRVQSGYNVKATAIGATGDGTTDDRAALHTLLNTTLQVTGAGGDVFFPPGTYLIGSNLTIPTNVRLNLDPQAMLKPDTGVTITDLSDHSLWDTNQKYTGNGTVSFSGNTKLTAIYPHWWGAKSDDSTQCRAAILAAIAARLTAVNGGNANVSLVFPAGIYRINAAVNFAAEGMIIQSLGQVVIKSTAGTGNVVEWDAGDNSNLYNCRMLGDWVMDGNNTAGTGLYVRNVHHSDFLNVRIRNVTTSGATILGPILSKFDITVSAAGDGLFVQSPVNGVVIGRSTGISSTTASKFHLVIENATGTGVVLTDTIGNTFTGTAEGLSGWGVQIASGSDSNNFDGFFCEGNKMGDFEISGSRNYFANCSAASGTPLTIDATPNSVSPTHITTHTAHNLTAGQYIVLDNYSGTLGTALNGLRQVNTVISPTEFTVAVATNGLSAFAPGPDVFTVAIVIKAAADQNVWTGGGVNGVTGGAFRAAAVEATANSNAFTAVYCTYQIFDSGDNTFTWAKQLNLSSAILPPQFINLKVGKLLPQGEGSALVIGAPGLNRLAPTHSIHQVGTGLIKTIDLPAVVSLPMPSGITIALIPTAAFTYDATGNVLGTGTATIGRTMFATYSPSTAKWSMSY